MNEEEKQEREETSINAEDKGNELQADENLKRIHADTERVNKAIAENANAKARARLSGVATAGTEQKTQYSEEEKASRARIKAVGDASGSAWAKNYE